LTIAIVFNGMASSLYKLSSINRASRTSILLLLAGFVVGGINAFCYTKSLASIRLSIAYPVFAAGSIILITIISTLGFKESLTVKQIVGTIIIASGIVAVSVK
jgi:multidrug transporter EmrE-like cation transporter